MQFAALLFTYHICRSFVETFILKKKKGKAARQIVVTGPVPCMKQDKDERRNETLSRTGPNQTKPQQGCPARSLGGIIDGSMQAI